MGWAHHPFAALQLLATFVLLELCRFGTRDSCSGHLTFSPKPRLDLFIFTWVDVYQRVPELLAWCSRSSRNSSSSNSRFPGNHSDHSVSPAGHMTVFRSHNASVRLMTSSKVTRLVRTDWYWSFIWFIQMWKRSHDWPAAQLLPQYAVTPLGSPQGLQHIYASVAGCHRLSWLTQTHLLTRLQWKLRLADGQH